MKKAISINNVKIYLSEPDEIPNLEWIGEETYMEQLQAAWIILDEVHDIPMNPQILGKPGVGKTTLAYCTAKHLEQDVYIFQCTVDTRPEDLLITPVIGENNTIEYHASSLVSAMIAGGICILDESNRMAEKSWASLAPLLDKRRYIESIIAGLKIKAHPNFRVCVTMNDDSSTFEIPEYIYSRLQPQIYLDFPEYLDEMKILQFNIPFARGDIITYVVKFLQDAHSVQLDFSVRDGINICRYYLKLESFYSGANKNNLESRLIKAATQAKKLESQGKNIKNDKESTQTNLNIDLLEQAIFRVLGKNGKRFYLSRGDNPSRDNSKRKKMIDFFRELEKKGQSNSKKHNFFDPDLIDFEKLNADQEKDSFFDDEINELDNLEEMEDDFDYVDEEEFDDMYEEEQDEDRRGPPMAEGDFSVNIDKIDVDEEGKRKKDFEEFKNQIKDGHKTYFKISEDETQDSSSTPEKMINNFKEKLKKAKKQDKKEEKSK